MMPNLSLLEVVYPTMSKSNRVKTTKAQRDTAKEQRKETDVPCYLSSAAADRSAGGINSACEVTKG
jgi:hypothetical protein